MFLKEISPLFYGKPTIKFQAFIGLPTNTSLIIKKTFLNSLEFNLNILLIQHIK